MYRTPDIVLRRIMSTDLTNALVNPLFGIGNAPTRYAVNYTPIVALGAGVLTQVAISGIASVTPMYGIPSNAFVPNSTITSSVAAGRLRLAGATSGTVFVGGSIGVLTSLAAPALPASLPLVQVRLNLFDNVGLITNYINDFAITSYGSVSINKRINWNYFVPYSATRTYLEVEMTVTYVAAAGGTLTAIPSNVTIALK